MPGREPARRSVSQAKQQGKGTGPKPPRTAAQKAVAGRTAKAEAKGAAKKAAYAGRDRARAAGAPVDGRKPPPRRIRP